MHAARKFGLLSALVFSAWSFGIHAEEINFVPDKEKLPEPKFGEFGWNPWVTIGGTISFGHSYRVVGQLDGQSWTLGASLDTGIDYQKGPHDWRNSFTVIETFTYGPPVDEFVKSADDVNFTSVYYFKIPPVPWLGPFARVELKTSFFDGTDVRTDGNNTWVKDGKSVAQGKRLKLTDSFFPLTLNESVGLFARPLSRQEIEWEFRAGLGAEELFADGQLGLADDSDTPEIEVVDLASYVNAGAELGTSVEGLVEGGLFSYKVWGNVMFPFLRTNKAPDDDRNAAEMVNVNIGARLSFKLVSWASLDYELRVARQPQLIDEFQVRNMLLLNFKYSPVKKKSAPADG